MEVVADLTSLWGAMSGAERGPDGRYPNRDDSDPLIAAGVAAYVRRTVVRQALRQDLRVAVTSGTPGTAPEYAAIAEESGATFTQRTIDPGEEVVTDRLANEDGILDPQCEQAIRRWYRPRRRSR